MKKALLLSFIFLAMVLSSATALTGNVTGICSGGTSILPTNNVDNWTETTTNWSSPSGVTFLQDTIKYIVGSSSISIRADSGAWRTIYLDFGSVDASGDSYFGFYGLRSAKGTTYDYLRLHTNSTNYYEYDNPVFSMSISNWTFYPIPKSNFTATGSPDWSNITYMSIRENPISPYHSYYIDGLGFYDTYQSCSALGTESECLMGNCTWNNESGIYVQGDFDNYGNISNTSDYKIYFDFIQQPVQIKGTLDGIFTYIGFYPMQDDYVYYAPFTNGTFIYHCNPDNVVLDASIICTGTLYDDNDQPVVDARIEWNLYNSSDVLFDHGEFVNLGNGAYKFTVDLSRADDYETGNYYFLFTAEGFNYDYTFPVFMSVQYLLENVTLLFTLIMLLISVITIIFGYFRRVTSFVIFGGFSLILLSMVMFTDPTIFGDVITNVFGVIFALFGFMAVAIMFFNQWGERERQREERKDPFNKM